MKTLILMMMGLFAASVSGADISTNYVAANPDLRIVNGKLYDRTKSVLWEEYTAQVVESGKFGLVVQTVPADGSRAPARAHAVLAAGESPLLAHTELKKRARVTIFEP